MENDEKKTERDVPYRETVGCSLFAATQLDKAFAVNNVAWYNDCYTSLH